MTTSELLDAYTITFLGEPAEVESQLGDDVVIEGDCIARMAELPDACVHAIVTDPPYGLGFMGKTWDSSFEAADVPMRRSAEQDAVNAGASRQGGRQRAGLDYQKRQARDARTYQEWCETWGREALRVLKPGGYLLAFGGTRTYHRLACAIEDAGFEIRDCLVWLYGSGFPKSHDVSKAIDKAAGAEREVVGRETTRFTATGRNQRYGKLDGFAVDADGYEVRETTAPATPDAERWQGWGTALKPAHEPIVLARKPLAGTVAANVLVHETGALHVDACRIGADGGTAGADAGPQGNVYGDGLNGRFGAPVAGLGRWPANVALDEAAAVQLDGQGGVLHSQDPTTRKSGSKAVGVTGFGTGESIEYADSGGASRFFYVAKASSAERNAGLDGFEAKRVQHGNHADQRVWDIPGSHSLPRRNVHPTVKPIDLMRWLVRLVTPPGGLVLDPFMGSGTTGIACALEGVRFVGIEREAEYAAIARARLEWWSRRSAGDTTAVLASLRRRDEHDEQLELVP